MVFLDNGSEDGTVAIARDHERVTVIQTKLPFKKYEFAMKQYLTCPTIEEEKKGGMSTM
jgi:hypothetical protein